MSVQCVDERAALHEGGPHGIGAERERQRDRERERERDRERAISEGLSYSHPSIKFQQLKANGISSQI